MRELSVYYCSKCGRYGYYQLVRNAICPTCTIKMTWLDIRYQDFMHLSLEERDSLLIHEIVTKNASISKRIASAERSHNNRQLIAAMSSRIQELGAENQKLNDTIEWMHQTIWDLLRTNKTLERQLQSRNHPQSPD